MRSLMVEIEAGGAALAALEAALIDPESRAALAGKLAGCLGEATGGASYTVTLVTEVERMSQVREWTIRAQEAEIRALEAEHKAEIAVAEARARVEMAEAEARAQIALAEARAEQAIAEARLRAEEARQRTG